MLFQNPDSESMIIVIILVIAVLILAIMLIATFVLLRSDAKPKNKIGSKDEVKPSLAVAVLDTLSEDGLKNEPKSSSLAGRFARLFPENGQKNTFKINQRAINLLGVPITVALMMGLILVLVLVNPTDKFYADAALAPWIWSILRIFIGIAGGGAIGVRIAHLSWRQTVLTALLTSAGAMLISRFKISPFEVPPFYFGPWDSSDGTFQFDNFLIGILAVSAPVFLLPLCDPLLTQSGLAPSRQKVLSVAFLITLMFVPFAQIAVGLFMGFTGFLLGMGVILSLYRLTESIGAEFGGLGLMLVLTSSFVWLAYVSGSFS
jgi:hypothetical protein